MHHNKAKILVVGPTESGKSSIANFLSDAGEFASNEYRPTKGCRIVEFEVPNVEVNGTYSNVEVELWDVSGDKRYANSWPVMQRGVNGVMFVFNPGEDDHPRMLETLHTQFVSQQGLKDSQCIVFCHTKPTSDGYASKLSSVFNGIQLVDSELNEENSGKTRQAFSKYLSQVFSYMSDMAEKHESSFLQ